MILATKKFDEHYYIDG